MTSQTRLARVTLAAVLAAASCAGGAGLASPQGAPLTIEVSGVPSSEGKVRVDVCTAATFLKTNCAVSGAAPAVAGTTTVTLDDLPAGTYAVQAFHDRNDDGHLDRGALGIPREGFGFSNNPPLGFKGPSFARASFVHGSEAQTIALKLRHIGGEGAKAPEGRPAVSP
jgi:uncharacterized protein (DUF2141 family)